MLRAESWRAPSIACFLTIYLLVIRDSLSRIGTEVEVQRAEQASVAYAHPLYREPDVSKRVQTIKISTSTNDFNRQAQVVDLRIRGWSIPQPGKDLSTD
jgi:hypothetical protein